MIDLKDEVVDRALSVEPIGNLAGIVVDLGLDAATVAEALGVSERLVNELLVVGGEFAKTAALTLLTKLNIRDDVLMRLIGGPLDNRPVGVDLAEVVRTVVLTEVNHAIQRRGAVLAGNLLTNAATGRSILDEVNVVLATDAAEVSTRMVVRRVVERRQCWTTTHTNCPYAK